MKLTAKEVGHGVTVERYAATNGNRVVVLVSTSTWADGSVHEDHYTILGADGIRSGIIYNRGAAMEIAESKVL